MQLSTNNALFQCKPTMLLWFDLILLQIISSQTNEYIGDNETIWESTSRFIPQSATSYGSIKIGESMKMEFDIVWNGRADPNNNVQYEQYFRVGSPSSIFSDYPSLWLQPNIDAFQLRISCTNCNEQWNINQPILSIGKSYHFIISFNTTQLTVYLDDKLIINDSIKRQQYIGNTVKIWFNSDTKTNENPYIVGNAIFSDITIISNTFSADPKLFYPNNTVLDKDNDTTKQEDLSWLVYIVIIVMVFAVILFCCYKSKQIRKQIIRSSGIENQINKSIINSGNTSKSNMKESEKLKSDSQHKKDQNNVQTPTSIPILMNIDNESLKEINIAIPTEKKLVIGSHSPSLNSVDGNGEIEVEMKMEQIEKQMMSTISKQIQINETNTNYTNERGETDINEEEYKWIKDALIKIDENKYEIYLNNFKNEMITDNRIKLLYEDDMKILIPEMGPRREFQKLLKNKDVVVEKQEFVD